MSISLFYLRHVISISCGVINVLLSITTNITVKFSKNINVTKENNNHGLFFREPEMEENYDPWRYSSKGVSMLQCPLSMNFQT